MNYQETILKGIHKNFLENWTYNEINFFTSKEKEGMDGYISLKYKPESDKKVYIQMDGYKQRGTLRVYAYEKEPQDVLLALDYIRDFLKNKTIESLTYTELDFLGSVDRQKNTDLFNCFIDFEVCLNK